VLDWWEWLPWDMWDDFPPSIAWGNIATVTVAIAAIVVSAIFNRRTLRLSADQSEQSHKDARGALDLAREQFEQRRRDEVDDKLRVEVATYLSAVNEREQQLGALLKQVTRISDQAQTQRQGDSQPDAADVDRLVNEINMALSDTVSLLYRRIGIQSVVIAMLTTEQGIMKPVNQIQTSVNKQRDGLRGFVGQARDFAKKDADDRAASEQQFAGQAIGLLVIFAATELAIKDATGKLVKYCLRHHLPDQTANPLEPQSDT
jgi:hypothetical protein